MLVEDNIVAPNINVGLESDLSSSTDHSGLCFCSDIYQRDVLMAVLICPVSSVFLHLPVPEHQPSQLQYTCIKPLKHGRAEEEFEAVK